MSALADQIRQAKAQQRKPHVLIVEPERTIASFLKDYLADEYDIVITGSGRQALELCRERPPNLILIDTGLQDMSALDLFQSLYSLKLIHRIPIFFLTQQNEAHANTLKALELGVDDIIRKPFDVVELQLRLQNSLPAPHHAVDAVTRLPGWAATEQAIQQWLERRDWRLLFVCIEQIRPYEDTRGSTAGNDLRRVVTGALNEVVDQFGRPHDFIGALGPQEYVILTTADTWSQMQKSLQRRLQAKRTQLFTAEEIANERLRLPDGRTAPLLDFTCTSLSPADGPFRNSLHLIETADSRRQQS